jgi:hypothetical protein
MQYRRALTDLRLSAADPRSVPGRSAILPPIPVQRWLLTLLVGCGAAPDRAIVDQHRGPLVAEARAARGADRHQSIAADLAGHQVERVEHALSEGVAAGHLVGDAVAEEHAEAPAGLGRKEGIEADPPSTRPRGRPSVRASSVMTGGATYPSTAMISRWICTSRVGSP